MPSTPRPRLILLLALAGTLTAQGCAEERSPADVDIDAHPDGWTDPDAELFHGSRVVERGTAGCITCHGEDYAGLGRAPGCVDCHAHPAGWASPTSGDFHGDAIAEGQRCASCHGSDFRGGWSGVGCFSCHDGPSGHPEDWLVSSSGAFHGARVGSEGVTRCRACHGPDLRGTENAPSSCYGPCHDGPGGHPAGWASASSSRFHGDAAGEGALEDCATCHGADFRGGWSGVSCYECHAGPSGHPIGWMVSNSASFHGQAVVDRQGYDTCTPCHGVDVRGGWSGVSCYEACHDGPGGHPLGWYNPVGSQLHDDAYYNEPPGYCELCHYGDDGAGWTGVGCGQCHGRPFGR